MTKDFADDEESAGALSTTNKLDEIYSVFIEDILPTWDLFEACMIWGRTNSLLKGDQIKRSKLRRNKEGSLDQLQKKDLGASHESVCNCIYNQVCSLMDVKKHVCSWHSNSLLEKKFSLGAFAANELGNVANS